MSGLRKWLSIFKRMSYLEDRMSALEFAMSQIDDVVAGVVRGPDK